MLFFFFQAEDGIRDLIVTGVQTCALPIFVVQCPDDLPRDQQGAHPVKDECAHWIGGAVIAPSLLPAWTVMIPATITAAPRTCSGCNRSPSTKKAIRPAKTGSAVATMPADDGRMVRSDRTKRACATRVPSRPSNAMTAHTPQSAGRRVPLTTSNAAHSRLP